MSQFQKNQFKKFNFIYKISLKKLKILLKKLKILNKKFYNYKMISALFNKELINLNYN